MPKALPRYPDDIRGFGFLKRGDKKPDNRVPLRGGHVFDSPPRMPLWRKASIIGVRLVRTGHHAGQLEAAVLGLQGFDELAPPHRKVAQGGVAQHGRPWTPSGEFLGGERRDQTRPRRWRVREGPGR